MKHVFSFRTVILTLTLPALLTALLLGIGNQISFAADTSIGGTGTSNIHLDQPGPASSNDKTVSPAVGGQVVVKLSAPLDSSLLNEGDYPFNVIAALEHSYTYLMQVSEGVYYDSLKTSLARTLETTAIQPNYQINELHPVQGSYPFSDINDISKFHNQPASEMLNLDNCRQVANGSGVKIAIIDGGADFSHPALENKVESGYDYIDKDNIAFDETGGKASGHGTFVAGVVHLAAPMASIVSYRIINAEGQGDGFSMARAIERAVDDGCRIINISLVLTYDHLAVNDAIAYAVSQGVVVVAAAGNNHNSIPIFPAANPNVISVAAIDTSLMLTPFSNYGFSIDICAPGNIIYSTYQNNTYAWWSGTSFSAPFVTGQAALIRQYAPALDPSAIRDLIVSTGTNINPYNTEFIGFLGGGMANPAGALMALGAIAGNCCTQLGDINNNGISYEIIDALILTNALTNDNPSLLGTCLGNADVNFDCNVDTEDLTFLNRVIAGDTLPFPDCASCSTYVFVPGISNPESCCTLPGDINSNGIAYEFSEMLLLMDALRYNDSTFLLPCMGNADIDGNCTIDYNDLTLMNNIIQGDSILGLACGSCQIYTFVPGIPAQDPCCTMPGDINSNGLAFEVADSILLYNALHTGNISYLGTCLGNADLTINCQIDTFDLRLMRQIITGDTVVFLDCNVCRSYDFIPDTAGLILDSAYIYATPWRFFAFADSPTYQTGNIFVGATGNSKFFTIGVLDTPDFITLQDTIGFTDDSISFGVGSFGLAPGVYTDSIIVYVDGVSNSPLIEVVYLTVDSGWVSGNQAWAHGIPHLTFIVPKGTDTVITRQLVVGSDYVPKPYAISFPDPPEFLQFAQTQGLTIDTVDFNVVCTADMTPGYHTDSFLIYVDSVTNSPLRMDVLLIIEADTVFTWDSTTVIPEELNFQIPYGSADSVHGSVLIYSSNAPAPCSSSVRYKPERFIYLPVQYGWTPDTLEVVVFAGNKTPGTYHDTVWVNVTGCLFKYLYVNLEVTAAAKSGSATELNLANYPNPFNSSTELSCTIPAAARATLKVYDILGREIITLVDDYVSAGPLRVQWNGTDRNGQPVASGIYLYRLQVGRESVSKRMILLK